jgi:hypothetical protein
MRLANQPKARVATRVIQKPVTPASLLIHYLASTMVSVLTWWAEQKNAYPAESMNQMYRSLVLPILNSNF